MIIYDTPTKIRRTFMNGALTGALVMWFIMLAVSYLWIERSKETTRFIDEQRQMHEIIKELE